MSTSLYRKYRSKRLTEIVGQEHITSTLSGAIAAETFGHAYLFTGPRGTGKTSIARIVAHEINKLPYNSEATHLDIIEIDAASNRRIDEIRDLRDKVHIAPTSAAYKVYIIDEVHMLTKEAFNALLKTLEEPPAHCVFILATTELHKVPATIVSRTQRFHFQPIDPQKVAEHLAFIAQQEGISITPEALVMLAEHGEGGMRDSISMLDQLKAQPAITDKDVSELLGIPPQAAIAALIASIQQGSIQSVSAQLQSLLIEGHAPAMIAKKIAEKLREQAVQGKLSSSQLRLLKQLLEIPASYAPADALEIAIIDAALNQQPAHDPADNAPPVAPIKKAPIKTPRQPKSPIATDAPLEDASPPKPQNKASREQLDATAWSELLSQAKQHASALYTALRLAQPHLNKGVLTLSFQFALHQKKVNTPTHKDTIIRLGQGIGVVIDEVICTVDKASQPPNIAPVEVPKVDQQPDAQDPVSTISNIFGGAEVLES